MLTPPDCSPHGSPQALYYIPELSRAVLAAQFNPTTFASSKGIAPDLGFLFHMLAETARASEFTRAQRSLLTPSQCRTNASDHKKERKKRT